MSTDVKWAYMFIKQNTDISLVSASAPNKQDANKSLDVSNLRSGMYKVVAIIDGNSLNGNFIKI